MTAFLTFIRSLRPRTAMIALCVVYLGVAGLTFDDYGVNPDEGLHIANGKAVVNWYASGFTDRGIFRWTNVWAYGGAYDVLCHFAVKFSPFEVHETRHLLTAVVGLVGVLGAYALGQLVGSPWVGVLAAIFLLLTPRYYGHAFFNHKDIPFAVGYIWSVTRILQCWHSFPRVPLKLIVLTGLAIGFALGLRVGGVILAAYLGLAAVVWLAESWRGGRMSKQAFLWVCGSSAAVFLIAYSIMLLAWPWAQLEPLSRPVWALRSFSKFPLILLTFFEGNYVPSTEIPWYYVVKWLALTLPETVLFGSLIGVAAGIRAFVRDRGKGFPICLVIFCTFFPVAYAIVKEMPLYNGMRHILFVLPLLSVITAYGFSVLAADFPHLRRGMRLVVGLLCAVTVYDLIVYHPNQYVYFNRLVAGGIAKASARYETDYYTNSYRAGIDWVEENADPTHRKFTGPPDVILNSRRLEFVTDPAEADFYLGRVLADEHLDVPGQLLHAVRANGVDLLHIIRPSGDLDRMEAPVVETASFYHERQAARYKALGRRDLALAHLHRATVSEPKSKVARAKLANLHFDAGEWEAAIREYEALLVFEPGSDMTYTRIAIAHHNLRRFRLAEENYLKALEIRSDQLFAMHQLGTLYGGSGMPEKAIRVLERVISLYPNYTPPKVTLMRVLGAANHFDQAIAFGRTTVEVHPELTEVHEHLVNLLINQGAWEEALGAVAAAIEADSGRVKLWYARAAIYRITGLLDSAIVALEHGLTLDPAYPELQSEIATLAKDLLDKGRAEACVQLCTKGLELDPRNAELWALSGLALVARGMPKDAARMFRHALANDPDHAEAKGMLEQTTSQ
jgi:tetratricopeptide (TPR) repeat protein